MKEVFKNYVTFSHEDDPLKISIIGETYCDKSFRIERECSDLNALEFIIDGEGVLCIDGQELYPQKDDIFFLRKGTKHTYYSSAENPWHKFWIVFEGSLAEALISCYLPNNIYLFKHCPIKKYFEEIISLSKQDISYEVLVNKVTLCLMNIFMYIRNQIQIDNEELPELVRKKLDESVEKEFNLDELCKNISYSKNHIIEVFKERYNITPYKYFLERKIDAAKAYLAHTNTNICEISRILHYADQQYFSTSFKKSVGVSPLEYRKRTRKANYTGKDNIS